MSEAFKNIFENLGVLAALVSGIAVCTDILSSKFFQRKKLNKLREQNFELLLQSSDIRVLGTYLDNEIGQLTISNYVDNESIKKEVDTLINKLTQFVGTDEQIGKEVVNEQNVKVEFAKEPLQEYSVPLPAKIKEDVEIILRELYHGEPWNSLARLRRLIEIYLKNMAESNNVTTKGVYSPIQLIEILKREQIMDVITARDFKYAIHVSNRAVHGEDIDKEEAESAIKHAIRAFNKIGK